MSAKKADELYKAMLQSGIRVGNVEGYYGKGSYGLGYDFAWDKGEDGYKNILNLMMNSDNGRKNLEGTYYHNFSPNAQAFIGGKRGEIWTGANFRI